MMQRIIKVNGVEVQQGVCVVDFVIESDITEQKDVTHAVLYKLLDTATNVKGLTNWNSSAFVEFEQGAITFIAYKRE